MITPHALNINTKIEDKRKRFFTIIMLYGVIGQQQTNIRKVYQTVLCINTILKLSGRILPKLGKTILIP